MAILNYERALWLSPGDSATGANLELARHRARLATSVRNPFEKAARVASANTLAWVGRAALALMALGLVAGRLLKPTWRSKARAIALTSAVVLALTGSALGYWWTRLERAVILTPNCPAHLAPASDAAVSFDLGEGQIVQEEKTYGDFALVRTWDGQVGWLAQDDLARIVPINGPVTTAARLQRKPSTTGLAQGAASGDR